MSPITIRRTSAEDLPQILLLTDELSAALLHFDELVNIKWSETDEGKKYYTSKVDGTKGACFVAEINNEFVGYALGDEKPDSYRTIKVIELVNLYVKEEYRNRGFGKMLVEAFRDWAAKEGGQKIAVSAYFFNKKSVQFYEYLGFTPYDITLEIPITEIKQQ